MKILALDTSTLMATCAVIDGDKVLGEYSLNQDMSHSEKLVPMIKTILDGLGLNIADIDLYGVAIGPGSFTGLRIGAATVKGFAHLFNKPLIGISTLEGLAFNLAYNEIIVPMIDARRDRVYTGIYTWEDGSIKTIMEDDVIAINDLMIILDKYEKIIVNGEGSLVYKEIIKSSLKDKVSFSTISQNSCRATSIGELALIKYNEGHRDNYYTLIPDYLRKTQAERELNEREQK
ncbi:tRNA (adenosine(37)-N6)-threonylcarbamoyltransferase complex dimerization subunit type 1 TsaB [Tissierella sp.]|uniref:tRNA (adenosine(37)-N6)-threonylcarbamoyltransferase complex dimerization subunit type 1 TsaB n=1 Tax=Tissierella sp. TaxID=41274 RepID=UPI00285576DE|nr:tRNA (adenosine(37)-N6)-threonylcarbamoyltransferase complex dimerization subunit type 1 TsaB [Tissierella sp.]MDR7856857.1 tRNA (adenosine(37)-N6)-threonylcarbamoyltransferase complex dimerization subunit type 1 TsaB [Tissierella sp.]